MTIRTLAISLACACSLAACAPTNTEPRQDVATIDDDTPPPAVERFIAPTPAMRAAALSGDLGQMRESVTNLLSCQSPSSCPGGFGACTNWSPLNECDVTCDFPPVCRCIFTGVKGGAETNARQCGPDDNEGRRRVTYDSFRICFNAAQEACTEWRQATGGGCNC